jgi:hypothetical protein
MKSLIAARRALVVGIVMAVSASSSGFAAAPASKAPTPPKGLRVYSAGHSFHMFMPNILTEIAKSAGIEGHVQVGTSSIGGSYIYQHWDKEGDAAAKVAVPRDSPNVFTMSPIYLPDDGIENFAKLVADKSPRTRILLQEFWLPYDVYDVNYKKQQPAKPDRDAMTADYLRTEYGKYFTVMDEHVRSLNKRLEQTVIYVVPVGQAVVALREKVIAGEVPGVEKQSQLFTDPIGHCTAPVKVLTAYCHYAVAYGRSPVGLPVPGALKGAGGDEATTAKLNTLLQELAWNAAVAHPLSGVKKN